MRWPGKIKAGVDSDQVGGPLELYDLKTDVGEAHNVAADHADVVAKIEDYLKTARTESADFPIKAKKDK